MLGEPQARPGLKTSWLLFGGREGPRGGVTLPWQRGTAEGENPRDLLNEHTLLGSSCWERGTPRPECAHLPPSCDDRMGDGGDARACGSVPGFTFRALSSLHCAPGGSPGGRAGGCHAAQGPWPWSFSHPPKYALSHPHSHRGQDRVPAPMRCHPGRRWGH